MGMKISGGSAARLPEGKSRWLARAARSAEEAAVHGAGTARHSERTQTASSQRDPESISLRAVNMISLLSVETVFSSRFSFSIESGFEKLIIAAGVPSRLPRESNLLRGDKGGKNVIINRSTGGD